MPFEPARLEPILPRVVRLILASGYREVQAEEVQASYARYCADAEDKAWNEDRCRGLVSGVCKDGVCKYEHFGSCTAFLLGRGAALTAAHCVAPLIADPALADRSTMVWPGAGGRPAETRSFRILRVAKDEFDKHWVTSDSEAMDVAVLRVDDGGLPPYPVGPVPARGSLVFVAGYPRVKRPGPKGVSGTPAVSFGRVDDPNADDRPLCSTDGTQEGWALARLVPGEGGQRRRDVARRDLDRELHDDDGHDQRVLRRTGVRRGGPADRDQLDGRRRREPAGGLRPAPARGS